MSCASEETLLEFIEGRLSPEAFEGVEQHLSECEACRELVAVATPAASPQPTGDDGSFPSGGQQMVGRYQVLGPIGAGGMGVVYAAHDPQLERKVALKMLRPSGLPGVSPQQLRARILREGRAMALLTHPNVLVVHDVGEFQDQVFVAMELAEGGTVASWLRERPRSWTEVLDVFLAAGRGLSAAHAKGLVHRDFKPDNILFGGDGGVRVTDFGLAQLLAVPGSELLTAGPPKAGPPAVSLCSSALVGSPAYMAPEQMRGEQADVPADIFSFCVSLYEALYGERPFAGETVAELQRAMSENDVRRPPAGTHVPAWIRRALLGGLRAEPGERPQTMEALLASLSRPRRRWLPLAVGPRLALLAGILGVAVLAVGAVLSLWLSRGALGTSGPPIRSLAVLPFKSFSGDSRDEYLELGLADTLIAKLSNIRSLVVRSTGAVRKYSGPPQDPLTAGREQRVDAVLEGSIQRAGDRLRVTVRLLRVRDGSTLWASQYDERQYTDIFAVQDSISERVAEALTLNLTAPEKKSLAKHYTENTDAYQLYLRGRYSWNKRTGEGFTKAIEYFNQAIDKDSNYALAYVGLADCYTMLADYDWLPPTEAKQQAKAAVTKALQIDESLAEAHTSLADIRRLFDWDWSGAEREYRRGVELNPNYATAHQWYAEYLAAMGRHDQAMREMKRAEELDPLSVVIKSAAGWVFFFARDYQLTIERCQKVIEMDAGYGEVYSQLRRAYEQKGMYSEALVADENLRAFRRKGALGLPVRPDLPTTHGPEDYWRSILRLTQNDLQSPEHKNAAQFRMAEIFAQLGETDQAFQWLDKAYQEHSLWLSFLRVHPHLDPLRADPRFQVLLTRVGLQN